MSGAGNINDQVTQLLMGASARTTLITSSASMASSSISNTSISAKRLNKMPLPSITGLEASGPLLPNPKMAVPLETTATRLPLAV